jgi:mono/diheme cytochrome c family protein
MRICVIAAVLAACCVDEAAASESAVRSLFKSVCAECHGAETQESGLRLDTLDADFAVSSSFGIWVRIHDRLLEESMPPEGSPQPTQAERKNVVDWLKSQLTEADQARRKAEGRAAFRRLNRTEYEFTLRDLFGLPDLPLREMLPEDGRVDGYDKSGDGLQLSHVQMSRYLEAADLAMTAATATQIERPEVLDLRVYPTQRNGFKSTLGQGLAVLIKDFKVDETIFAMPGPLKPPLERKQILKDAQQALEDFRGSVGIFRQGGLTFNPGFNDFMVADAGMYRVRVSLWSFTWDRGNILPATKLHTVKLMTGPRGKERSLGYFDIQSLTPTVVETTVWLRPGDQIGYDAVTLLPLGLTGAGGRVAWVGQGVAADWLEVEGPLLESWPPPSHQRLFADLPLQELDADSKLRVPDRSLPGVLGVLRGQARSRARRLPAWAVHATQPKADAKRLLDNFLSRAFRRPVSKEEVSRYVKLMEQMLSENLTFEEAMRWAYKTALCSPEFLFFAERPGTLSDWALASRLSYFLWNSMPDETLLSLAAEGQLRDPAVLRQQVDRMLTDAKAQRFVNDFVDQWLDLKDIDATTPDRKLYPEFNTWLNDSMLAETRGFFRELVDGNLNAMNIVDSDFAMLDQRLAEHYGIGGVDGAKFRRVSLAPDSHRGGLITQAALMKVTANGTTTTPVKRGAWVMRAIVGKPPAPPPPNIPAVEPDVNGTTTIREQLDKHRSQQVCASCHAEMDPPGFALESYDVIGSWRTRYRSLGEGEPTKSADGRNVRYLLGPPVDPSGHLSDGRKFSDIQGFRKLLLSDQDQIARNLINQLITYSTGTTPGFGDRPVVEEILSRVRTQQYGLRSIIHEIVQSRLFLEK